MKFFFKTLVAYRHSGQSSSIGNHSTSLLINPLMCFSKFVRKTGNGSGSSVTAGSLQYTCKQDRSLCSRFIVIVESMPVFHVPLFTAHLNKVMYWIKYSSRLRSQRCTFCDLRSTLTVKAGIPRCKWQFWSTVTLLYDPRLMQCTNSCVLNSDLNEDS